MKKIIYSILTVVAAFNLVSCMEVDNWDAPEASIHGTVYNVVTGKPILIDQGDSQIKIWERSFDSENPGEQGLNIAWDGTYTNTRLFPGTYDMFPNNGPWWKCDTIRGVKIGNSNNATQDFRVIPYLVIEDFQIQYCPRHKWEKDENGNLVDLGLFKESKDEVSGLEVLDTLRLKCRIAAPVTENLPQLWEVRSFISNYQYCGPANGIGYYGNANDEMLDDMYNLSKGPENKEYYTFKKVIKKRWNALGADEATPPMTVKFDEDLGEEVEVVDINASPEAFQAGMAHLDQDYVIRVPIKRGYKYTVRMGANVDDQHRKYSLSEIKEIVVPMDPSQTPSWSENFE